MDYEHQHVCVPKLHNERTTITIGGVKRTFDSRKEARRYQILRYMEMGGQIENLRMQVTYELIPKQKDEDGNTVRACKYVADFVYQKDGETIVEDVKGYKGGATYEVFKIKKKLMLYRHGITVKEV